MPTPANNPDRPKEEAVFKSLKGLRILVTGANRGLGQALAEHFEKEGAKVLAHSRKKDAALSSPFKVHGDLQDPQLLLDLDQAIQKLGGLDLAIFSAGQFGEKAPLASLDVGLFQEVMETNVTRQVALFQCVFPYLKKAKEGNRKGLVIWLTSGLGRFALPDYGAYCASKHGVEALAKLAHEDHQKDGILSIAVAPGMVQTEMLKLALGEEDVSSYTPPEVAAKAFQALILGLKPSNSGKSLDLNLPSPLS